MRKNILESIHWHGHASFRVEGARVIYFDPFRISDGLPAADVIFVSHSHHDHFSPDDIKKISTEKTTLVVTHDIDITFPGEVIKVKPGAVTAIRGLTAETLPAYNIERPYHPQKNNWVGYVITMDNTKIYHTGDSDFIEEMRGLVIDVILIPVVGTYTMDAAQAAQAIKEMEVTIAIPMHWGTLMGDISDARRFKDLVGDAADVRILQKE